MSEQPVTADQPPEEKMSFMDRAAGVFYEPSEVFRSLKNDGVKTIDWLVPLAILAILVSLATYVNFSTPDLRMQFVQMQEQRIEKSVNEGKMTADQAQQARDRMEGSSGMFMAFGILGAIVGISIMFFITAGVWLLVGKYFLKGTSMTYAQAMGIAGTSSWIMAVGTIVGIVIAVMFSRFDGGLHLGLLTQMDNENKVYVLLRNVNLFTLWNLAASANGITVFSGKKGFQSYVWVFGIWAVLVLANTFLLGGIFG